MSARYLVIFLFSFLQIGFAGSEMLSRQSLFKKIHSDAASAPRPTEILFQGFAWNVSVDGEEGSWYDLMGSKARELAKIGITQIWYPPVSRSVSKQGYMPGDYYDLGTPENETYYGNIEELKESIHKFHKEGIDAIADIVINHRTASHKEDGIWNVFHHKSGKMWWEKWALAKDDYGGTGNYDSGGNFEPAPDIDHSNPIVRRDIINWLRWMKSEVGFDGWRFDFVKGYQGLYVQAYIRATDPTFAVGEYWSSMGYQMTTNLKPDQDPHRQLIVDWIDDTRGKARAFDFTTKGILQEAVKEKEYWRLRSRDGKAAGVLGWWPERSVTFLDNHDTGSKQSHWPFPSDDVLEGYAYILTHPGTPTIFWDHYFEWGDFYRAKIRELSEMRHGLNIHRESNLQILEARNNLYVAKVDDKLILKLGSLGFDPGSEWESAISGPGYYIWVRK
ncbi:MAG: alpha-amylase family glycosyl hydrolase [bacterium]|nr:alpha-amylase family glycosyl hydrolase [bacterium]